MIKLPKDLNDICFSYLMKEENIYYNGGQSFQKIMYAAKIDGLIC